MCKCTPEVRTPYCGKLGCEWPKPEGVREPEAESQQRRTAYPVQLAINHYKSSGSVSSGIYLAAYEVYAHVYGEQQALIEGHCRGGFGVGELIAFLYARGFPKEQWETRVKLAFNGMDIGR